MGQQTLRTVITIGGSVDNSFGVIGDTLMGLGSQIDGLSRKIIDFGKDGVEEFINYDDLMREVKAVGEFTEGEMKALDAINTQIARTSIYTNKQAAEAEVFLGQLGLSVQEIKTLLPDVLELAQAGHLSIADSADYLYSSIKSLGLAIEDSDELTDMMAKTAAVGATDIDTLGESLTRMGSGLKMFKDGAPEVLAMLSGISQFGEDMRGQEGGTRLRNFMLSLVAPAGSGKQLLAELENLGMDQAEMNAYLEDEGIDLTSSAAAIQKLGLKVFDEAGNMRAATDIVVDLFNATKGMNDDLRSMTLRQIFGRREYIAAQNLMKPLEDDIDYYEKLIDVITNSEGFAGQMADEMQGGAGGAIRSLDASFADLKKTIGGLLEEDVIGVSDWLNDIVTSIAGMDEGKLSALVYGMGGIAAAGPTIMGVGAFLRTLGFLMTPAGAYGAGILAIAGLAGALDKLDEARFAANFGTMELNEEEIRDYVVGIGEDFTKAYGEINTFNTTLNTAVENYQTKSKEFTGDLVSKMLTGTQLTKEDKEKLQGLAGAINDELIIGIQNSTASSMTFMQMLFGGPGVAKDDPAYTDSIALLNLYYQESIGEAQSYSEQLRSALFSAFEDDVLTTEETQGILTIFENIDQLMADQVSFENRVEQAKLFHDAKSASYEEIQKYADLAEEQRDKELETWKEEYRDKYFKQQVLWDDYISQGKTVDGKPATEERKNAVLEGIDRQYEELVAQTQLKFDDFLTRLWGTGIENSALGGMYEVLGNQVDLYMGNQYSKDHVNDWFKKNFNVNERDQLGEYMTRYVESLGGLSEVVSRIGYLEGVGDQEGADGLRKILAIKAFATDFADTWINEFGIAGIWDDKVFKNSDPEVRKKNAAWLQELLGVGWAAGGSRDEQIDWTGGRGPGNEYTQEFIQAEPPLIIPDVEDGTGAGEAWTEQFESGAGRPEITVKINWGALGSMSLGGGGGAMNPLGISSMLKYADGGYADEPSIFGEAGGEWAIPEQHSQRTASLLDAAREGAGFSWGELIARNGGLNANAGQGVGQIIYSPRIYAQDARGVKEELEADKIRFRRAMEEYILTEETETYS